MKHKSGTFSKMYVQTIFAVKGRASLIDKAWEERSSQYITGIIKKKGQKLLAINGTSNHIHIFMDMKPTLTASELVREVKKSSNEFINGNRLSRGRFSWQEGFGVFTYSRWDRDTVIKYVLNQKEHHKTKTFKEEYLDFLRDFEIDYDEKFLFDWVEE